MNTKSLLLAASVGAIVTLGTAAAQTADPQRPYTDEQPGFYVGGGYTFIDIETDSDIDAFDDQGDNTNALTGRVGYQLTPIFAIEADATFGIDDGGFDLDGDEINSDDDFDAGDFFDNVDNDTLDSALATGGDIGLDYLVGAYGRVGFPINEKFHVSGRAGYAFAEVDVTNTVEVRSTDADGATVVQTTSRSVGGSDDGFAFGASANYDFNDQNAVRLDYTRYNFGDSNADAITVSYEYTFGGPGVGY